jgi:hypothetical protein
VREYFATPKITSGKILPRKLAASIPSPAGATAAVLRFSIGRVDTDRYIASFSDPQGDVAILFVLPPSVILELRNGRTDLPPQ